MKLPAFYPILDIDTAAKRGIDPIDATAQIIEGGATILQFRHKGFWFREMFYTLEGVAELCGKSNVTFIVNDRADLARLVGAGLHLGQDDVPPTAARTILGNSTLGFSTHNEAQLRAADHEPADYLALGPIFGTGSKANPDPVVGLEGLRRLRPLTQKPLVAIGGIARQNAFAVLEAGADSVAVIGDLFPEDGSIADRVRDWLEVTTRAR